MSDIENVREKLRDRQSAPSRSGPLAWVGLASCGAVVGFMLIWAMPRLAPLVQGFAWRESSKPAPIQKPAPTLAEVREAIEAGRPPPPGADLRPLRPSASLPVFQRVEPGAPPPPRYRPDPAIEARPKPDTNYAGKEPQEIARNADEACFQRAHARYPHWLKSPRLTVLSVEEFQPSDMDHYDELLSCLVSEGPSRYCSGSERRMITGEIVFYFKAIRFNNEAFDKLREQVLHHNDRDSDSGNRYWRSGMRRIGQDPNASLVPGPNVVSAIEGLLRSGILSKSAHDKIVGTAPEHMGEWLARIEPRPSPCPAQPWWAFLALSSRGTSGRRTKHSCETR